MTDARTHYDVLGIARDASKDDIRAAYRERLDAAQAEQAKAREGKRPNEQAIASARADEAEIRAAWQVLSDPYQRGRYDALNLPPDGEVATSPPSTNGEVDTTGVPAVLDDADADDTPAPKGRQSRRAQLDAMRPPVFTDDGTQLELAPSPWELELHVRGPP